MKETRQYTLHDRVYHSILWDGQRDTFEALLKAIDETVNDGWKYQPNWGIVTMPNKDSAEPHQHKYLIVCTTEKIKELRYLASGIDIDLIIKNSNQNSNYE